MGTDCDLEGGVGIWGDYSFPIAASDYNGPRLAAPVFSFGEEVSRASRGHWILWHRVDAITRRIVGVEAQLFECTLAEEVACLSTTYASC